MLTSFATLAKQPGVAYFVWFGSFGSFGSGATTATTATTAEARGCAYFVCFGSFGSGATTATTAEARTLRLRSTKKSKSCKSPTNLPGVLVELRSTKKNTPSE